MLVVKQCVSTFRKIFQLCESSNNTWLEPMHVLINPISPDLWFESWNSKIYTEITGPLGYLEPEEWCGPNVSHIRYLTSTGSTELPEALSCFRVPGRLERGGRGGGDGGGLWHIIWQKFGEFTHLWLCYIRTVPSHCFIKFGRFYFGEYIYGYVHITTMPIHYG